MYRQYKITQQLWVKTMNKADLASLTNAITQDTDKIPLSALKRDIKHRKQVKEYKQDNRVKLKSKDRVVSWGELHPLVNSLHSILSEYATIGLLGNEVIKFVPDEEVAQFTNNIKLLYTDINVYLEALMRIKVKVKESTTRVGSNEMPEFFNIYEDLDALRIDITTVLTPTSMVISEVINKFNQPKELVNV